MLASGRLRGVLLPIVHKDSKLARIWLRYLHEVELLHVGGRGTLWGESCRQLYIWHGSNLAKKVVRDCIPCRRLKISEREQKMAPLPPVRLANISGEAFENSSIDYAGPFKVMPWGSRRTTKVYVLVVVCLATRALHLEMTLDQKAQSVLLALQRLASLRRMPRMIYSDNAADFLHCAKIFEESRLGSAQQGGKYQSWRDVYWEFSTPASPHTNGSD